MNISLRQQKAFIRAQAIALGLPKDRLRIEQVPMEYAYHFSWDEKRPRKRQPVIFGMQDVWPSEGGFRQALSEATVWRVTTPPAPHPRPDRFFQYGESCALHDRVYKPSFLLFSAQGALLEMAHVGLNPDWTYKLEAIHNDRSTSAFALRSKDSFTPYVNRLRFFYREDGRQGGLQEAAALEVDTDIRENLRCAPSPLRLNGVTYHPTAEFDTPQVASKHHIVYHNQFWNGALETARFAPQQNLTYCEFVGSILRPDRRTFDAPGSQREPWDKPARAVYGWEGITAGNIRSRKNEEAPTLYEPEPPGVLHQFGAYCYQTVMTARTQAAQAIKLSMAPRVRNQGTAIGVSSNASPRAGDRRRLLPDT